MGAAVDHWYAFRDHSPVPVDLRLGSACPRGIVSCPQIRQALGRHLVGMRMKRGASMSICGGHEVVAAYSCGLGG